MLEKILLSSLNDNTHLNFIIDITQIKERKQARGLCPATKDDDEDGDDDDNDVRTIMYISNSFINMNTFSIRYNGFIEIPKEDRHVNLTHLLRS